MSSPAFEIVQFLARSDNRVAVLTSLATDTASTRAELQAETAIPGSTISRVLSELGDRDLVSSDSYRYEVTPLGGFLANRLQSLSDAIESMRRLQAVLVRLSASDPAVEFADRTSYEVLTPTSADPEAPTRRFADRIHAATRIHMAVQSITPVLLGVDNRMSGRKQRLEIVIPRMAYPGACENLKAVAQLHDGIASGRWTLFVYGGDIPHTVGTIDDIAVIGLVDKAGRVHGYIETSDEGIRSGIAETLAAYKRAADRIEPGDLTG